MSGRHLLFIDQPLKLTTYKCILKVAVPAAFFRVSSVLCSTLLTSLVSRHGGTDMLAAFAAVAVSTKTASSLFAFLGEGVAAKVGRSAAWEAPAQTRARVGVYLGSAAGLGAAAAAVLLGLREHLLRPFHMAPEVHAVLLPYWTLLSLLLPALLLNTALTGTLQALQRVTHVAVLEGLTASAEVAGAYLALTQHEGGEEATGARLQALALVKWAAAVVYLSVAGLLVWLAVPRESGGATQIFGGECRGSCEIARNSLLGSGGEEARLEGAREAGAYESVLGEDSMQEPLLPRQLNNSVHSTADSSSQRLQGNAAGGGEVGRMGASVCGMGGEGRGNSQLKRVGTRGQGVQPLLYLLDLGRDGANIMVRSVVVQGSMWLTSVGAARLGTAPLAAHHVLNQVWMLPSHFLGGLGVVGVVLGSRVALGREQRSVGGGELADGGVGWHGMGSRRGARRLSLRLVMLALTPGLGVGLCLAVWHHQVSSLFHPKPEVAGELAGSAWAALCALQPVTSVLFTLTGLIYGAQYFAFMRNVLLAGFLGLFCPLLWWVVRRQEAIGDSRGDVPPGAGLGEVWAVKLAFYVWQAVAEGVGVATAYGWWS